ncbi:MAG TPA: enoyl-CoA hydratase-related protein [Kineosporiaceae bacterium]|nr:enoyl-CoA hydratase-related protein [Kineosporiaceae bacterium]
MSELVHRRTEDGVSTITLDSPANRNALSAALRAQLREHLTAAAQDEATRVVVLSHTGPVFCSGMDLREARGLGAQDAAVLDLPAILEAIWTHPKPVLARVAGPARAGGVGIVAACDIALAAESATFAFTEVRIGVTPAVISAVIRPRMLPRAVHELFLTGETFDARRAERTGLITAAVPAERLGAEVDRYTAMLRLGAPGALAGTKQLLSTPPATDLAAELAVQAERSARYFAAAEAAEGMRAFAEKRPPAWT